MQERSDAARREAGLLIRRWAFWSGRSAFSRKLRVCSNLCNSSNLRASSNFKDPFMFCSQASEAACHFQWLGLELQGARGLSPHYCIEAFWKKLLKEIHVCCFSTGPRRALDRRTISGIFCGGGPWRGQLLAIEFLDLWQLFELTYFITSQEWPDEPTIEEELQV